MMRRIYDFIYSCDLCSLYLLLLAVSVLWIILTVKYSRQCMWQTVNILLFAAALFFVLYFTLIMRSHRDDSCISLNIIAKLLRIKGVDDLEREVIMNAVLFFPLGLAFSQIIYRENAGKAFRTTVAFAFLLSFCVEALQVAFSCGTAELSDLLLNTFGAAVGALPVLIAEKVK